jgi:hypothetical protein
MIKQNCGRIVMACLIGLSLAVPALADDEDEEEKYEDSRSCIQTRSLKSNAVVDDRNILFVKKGNSVYLNILPKECKGLSRTKLFSYSTTTGSLCRLDLIWVVDISGHESRSCRLGTFYAITTDELRALVEESRKAQEE